MEPQLIRAMAKAKAASPEASNRSLAAIVGVTHPSVAKVLERAEVLELPMAAVAAMDDAEIRAAFYPKAPGRRESPVKSEPDFVAIAKVLEKRKRVKTGVTRMLLWLEYVEEVGEDAAYGYSSFCAKLREYDRARELTMVLHFEPGQASMADYAGMKVPIWDAETGKVAFEASIFVMALGYSAFVYAEAQRRQDTENCIGGHVRAYESFGGVPRESIVDNLRALVVKNARDELVLTQAWEELCLHYQVSPAPARPFKPRDKAVVEAAVNLVETRVLAPLRHLRFFSIEELGAAMAPLVDKANSRPFQKMPGSRRERFETEAKALSPLPGFRYEYAPYQPARVGSNYHVAVDGVYYSVPFHFAHHKAMVRLGSGVVSVFVGGNKVASHPRQRARGSFVTNSAHMPESHRAYLVDAASSLRTRADAVGASTRQVVEAILASSPFAASACRSAGALLRLAKAYSPIELEEACAMALAIASPTRASVSSILKKGLHRTERRGGAISKVEDAHENLRGREFFVVPTQEASA